MADKNPTVGQAMSLREDAIAKGVTREQWQRGGVVLCTALNAIRNGVRIKLLPPIAAPSWGRIHFVDGVTVQLDRWWREAVQESAPDSERSSSGIFRAQRYYAPVSSAVIKANLVLVDFSENNVDKVFTWAATYDLSPAPPRHVFALCAQHPDIHKILNRDALGGHDTTIVSPVGHGSLVLPEFCSVHFLYERRTAYTHSEGCFNKAKNQWAVFIRE